VIFKLTIGSSKTLNEAYAIRVPITTAPTQRLETGEGVCFKCSDLRIEIVPEMYFYSLTVRDFPSEADARGWLERFSVALLWVMTKFRMGILFESTPAMIDLREPPITIAPGSFAAPVVESKGWREIDGFYSADETVIRPEHKKLLMGTVGRPTIIGGIGLLKFIEGLEEGLQHARPDTVLANRKLRLAIEIYASSFFESSRIAMLLTRMMVLEALALPATRPKPILTCVDAFIEQLNLQREYLVEGCGTQEFDSLAGSLRRLKEKSINQTIRCLLEETLSGTPEASRISEFKRTYDVRSRLVHVGHATQGEIDDSISTLDVLVPAVLKRLLMREASRDHSTDVL
jgi:hypothetical protein